MQELYKIGTPVMIEIQGTLVRALVYNYYTHGTTCDYAVKTEQDFHVGEIEFLAPTFVRIPKHLVIRQGVV